MANSSQITCFKSTVYRHFHKGYYSSSIIDLPRAVKFKTRKIRREDYVPSGVKIGRSHDDFLDDIAINHIERRTELDTVIGHMEQLNTTYEGYRIGKAVVDSGYESEENYCWFEEENRPELVVKPSNHEQKKKKKYRTDISRRENMLPNCCHSGL